MIESLVAATSSLIGTGAYFSPWVWRLSRMSLIRKQVIRNRVLALTYDDGPSEAVTPGLLDLLRKNKATATFFMLGRNARQYPHIADQVLREGHDIGCHSAEHLNAWKAAPSRAVADINAGYEQLSTWVRPNGMFRPPYGKMTLPTYFAVHNRGASVWWWTIDSGDTNKTLPSPQEVTDTLLRERGGIILMHDVDRSLARNNFVLETTAALLELAKRNSFSVVPLRKLCR
jgi:peptidoglycan/xylan/chitin deacetylase (PgdA/CDA1 family)